MKKFTAIAIALLFSMGFGATVAKADGYSKQKVVYHVNYDDAKRQMGALRNIQNHINAVGKDKLDLRVVMHGNGVTMLQTANTDLELQNRIVKLKDQGIKFQMCANTLKGKKIEASSLFGLQQSDIVPSGVAEIAHLQKKGFSYIRP
jgi:intracellular sulfur oxidation DsrE/DsrF family protein